MKKLNEIEFKEEALDIIEQAESLTSDQLAALQQDDELSSDVAFIHKVKSTMQPTAPVDIEARLRLFHSRMERDEEQKSLKQRLRTITISLLATAAVLIGAIFYLHTAPAVPTELPEGMIFAADTQRSGISITTEQGDKVMLATTGSQSRSISLSDFQEVLQEIGVSEKVTLDVPYGSSADITLPDGTIVYMHPGARLIFPNHFTGPKREVIFEGEAYFKVAHDAAHPFVITSGTMETTVLGTEFNISTLQSTVVLVNGSVSLRETTSNANVLLKPHQQAVLAANKSAFTVTPANVEPYEFWRDGYLYFEQAELQDIMQAIGRNFNMSVVFRNDAALHYRMRFITERNKGVEAALQTMNEMGKAHVSVQGTTIYVD